jgi:hypothetical protein
MIPVATFLTDMFAPGTTPPDVSDTVPDIVAPTICAESLAGTPTRTDAAKTAKTKT